MVIELHRILNGRGIITPPSSLKMDLIALFHKEITSNRERILAERAVEAREARKARWVEGLEKAGQVLHAFTKLAEAGLKVSHVLGLQSTK